VCLKLKEKFTNPLAQGNLIDDNSKVAIELACLASNIKKEVCVVLYYTFSFLRKYEKKGSQPVGFDV